MIDLLMSGDLLLGSPTEVDRMVQLLVDVVGLPEQRPSWGHDFPGSNYKAMFARVHPKLSVAPTTMEVLAPRDTEVADDPNVDAWRAQRDRAVRTHATVFASRSFDDVVEHVRHAGVRHTLFPPDASLPFGRLWLGIAPDGGGYRPESDGGLRIEVIPYDVLRIPEGGSEEPRPEGSLERMAARTYLVDDVPATLERIRAALGWDGDASVVDGRHGPTAVLQPAEPTSSALELVRPDRPGHVRDFFERFGPGPYSVRLAANGLDAVTADLRRRGTRYERDGDVVTIEPDQLEGAVVELVELADPSNG